MNELFDVLGWYTKMENCVGCSTSNSQIASTCGWADCWGPPRASHDQVLSSHSPIASPISLHSNPTHTPSPHSHHSSATPFVAHAIPSHVASLLPSPSSPSPPHSCQPPLLLYYTSLPSQCVCVIFAFNSPCLPLSFQSPL